MDRWSIYIDIEGFSHIYPNSFVGAVKPLGVLMECIYRVGERVCSQSPDRLFAHQTGDGFLIVSEFYQDVPRLPIAIAIFLLRFVALAGGVAKGAISKGDFADITGCYPREVMGNRRASDPIRMGAGLMTIFPVMGTALINPYRLMNREQGSVLLIDNALQVPEDERIIVTKCESDYSVIDWVHSSLSELDDIHKKTGYIRLESVLIESRLTAYINENTINLKRPWIESTLKYNGLSN